MISIIGAGPAGLSAAYHLKEEYVIFERDEAPGGLCRSFSVGDSTLDVGGHAFFSSDPYVYELLDRLGVELYAQARNAVVYSNGVFVPYPFQWNLFGLPPEVVADCVTGAFRTENMVQETSPANMAEWIERSFGIGILKHFLGPYNEKIWGYPLEDLAPAGTSDRVLPADPEKILKGALSRASPADYLNSTVRYPTQGGFIEIFRPLIERVTPHLVRRTVTGIDFDRREILFADHARESYDQVISTMPLTELVAGSRGLPPCCCAAAEELKYNSLHLVNLVFAAGVRPDFQRVYCADPEVPFHKLVLNTNSSPWLRTEPSFSFQAEVSFTPHKKVSKNGLVENVLAVLRTMKLVEKDDVPLATCVVEVSHAYPVHTAGTQRARQHLLEELARRGVLGAGRFGEWLYINSDKALIRGKARAEEINGHH